MTAGKAIIASATSGIPEAIVDGRDGLLVTPGDVGSLAQALGSLLTDPARRRALGARAASRALEEFTVEVMAERYETLYADALSASGRGAQNTA
jgi:glycosyltransferase involved in cell wall biosynthesis